MELLGYILILIMGISLGMLGGGGSILTVPILIYLFKVDTVSATAYSLFIVGLAAGFGAFKKYKEGFVDLKIGLIFAIPGFLGVFISRSLIIPKLPESIAYIGQFHLNKDILIMLIFAIMMILASISMIQERNEIKTNEDIKKNNNLILIAIEGLFVGALTGFVGAGGGFMIIPALVVLTKTPMKVAIGTSLMIISFKSLFGFLGDVMVNPNIQWNLLLSLSTLSIVGIFIGSHLVQFIPEKSLKIGFGYFVLLMGTLILGQQLYG